MTSGPTLAALVRHGVLDAELAALLWLLVEGGVPVIVTGEVDGASRAGVAGALLGLDPGRPWVLIDADSEPPRTERLAAVLQGGVGLGLSLAAADLRAVVARLTAPPDGLAEDAVRRLGVVLVLGQPGRADRGPATSEESPPATDLRILVAHYLRPTERDAEGHIQRRPPAVLATWDAQAAAFEHFAWGITPELAERIDRSRPDLEARQASRAAFLAELARSGPVGRRVEHERVTRHLAGEPPREPAPGRRRERPSSFDPGLLDRHRH
jgi:hypothetical protein